MLESIISPDTAERDPWDMLILAFLVSSIALWIAYLLESYIPADPSMLTLAITVMALAPLIYRVIAIEEEKEELESHRSLFGFITRHWSAIEVYSFLFLGLLASFSFWYIVLPHDALGMPSSGDVFSIQESSILNLQQQISGHALQGSNANKSSNTAIEESNQNSQAVMVVQEQYFVKIYSNNLKVMWFCFLASALFGAGALWLIAWNASVIGTFIGIKIQANFTTGLFLPLGLSLWAIPEVLAYLVAAMAGGVLSVAVARHHFKSERFWLTAFDSALLLLFSFFLIVIGAYVEHFFIKV